MPASPAEIVNCSSMGQNPFLVGAECREGSGSMKITPGPKPRCSGVYGELANLPVAVSWSRSPSFNAPSAISKP